MRSLMLALIALVATASAGRAASETPDRAGAGTTLSLQAGLSSGSMHDVTGALGGTLLQDLGRRWAIEASGSFLGGRMGAQSFTAAASLLWHVRPTTERAAPYLALGGGLYRTRFDMGEARMRATAAMPGGGMHPMGGPDGPGPATRAYGDMPHFYAQRMPAAWDPQAGPRHRAFTDPAVSVGAGMRVDLGSRMFLRPDGRLLIALSGGDSFTVGLMTVSFGWRF